MTTPLAAAAHAVGIFPQYTQHTTPIALKIREKKMSWSGDDFNIKDAATGAVVFRVDGKAMSFRGRKELYDPSGKHLFTLLKQPFHLHATFEGRNPTSDQAMFTVKSSFSFGTKLTASYLNAGQAEELRLKGNFWDRKAEITLDGVPVARISRNFMNAGQLVFGQQTYYLTIAPGVDAALLAAICICLDEKANER